MKYLYVTQVSSGPVQAQFRSHTGQVQYRSSPAQVQFMPRRGPVQLQFKSSSGPVQVAQVQFRSSIGPLQTRKLWKYMYVARVCSCSFHFQFRPRTGQAQYMSSSGPAQVQFMPRISPVQVQFSSSSSPTGQVQAQHRPTSGQKVLEICVCDTGQFRYSAGPVHVPHRSGTVQIQFSSS